MIIQSFLGVIIRARGTIKVDSIEDFVETPFVSKSAEVSY